MRSSVPSYKVVLLGEGRVGKTSLISRFVNDTFDAQQRSTTQASMYSSVNVPLLNSDKTVNLNVWDTAGQERFHALGPIYYRNANGAILVYDVTDADTLEKVRLWIRELRAVVGDQIQLVVCANKSDLEQEREVSEEKGRRFAKDHGAQHLSTSARTGMNVAEAFQTLATAIASSAGATGGGGSGGGGSNNNNSASGAGGSVFFESEGSSAWAPKRRKRRGLLRIEDDMPGEDDEVANLVSGGGGKHSTVNLSSNPNVAAATPRRNRCCS
ncbi:ras-related protein Rab21, putative [Trypanosoma equiperdum]|uniref:Ras-related protein Rab-21 n=2 Tax=Trypanozoon TaxID=39700 RepID=Q38C89_TRYB2|nr:small GTPase, putative [Trypanosoma brucei brucei TREU927]EAN77581.1 small GTPase, putative [Trypanosoma brucei brucei TREU927]SCU64878.1 ras-related protein Rab21, putative [Trypanosoma equiperdum]